jgi:hypothetical protein
MQNVLYVLYLLYILFYRWLLSSGPWNSNNQPSARVILLCITVWCWVIPNTRVSNGFTATHFPQNPSTAVIAWTWSWLGRRVSIMAPLLCRRILSGMLGFCFCSQHLLWLTLDQNVMKAIGVEGTMGYVELLLYQLWLLYQLFQFVWYNQFNWYNAFE